MEQLDMTRLQRRKPKMDMPDPERIPYRDRACDLALKMLHKHGIRVLCVDALHGVSVTSENWVHLANAMYDATLFYENNCIK